MNAQLMAPIAGKCRLIREDSNTNIIYSVPVGSLAILVSAEVWSSLRDNQHIARYIEIKQFKRVPTTCVQDI